MLVCWSCVWLWALCTCNQHICNEMQRFLLKADAGDSCYCNQAQKPCLGMISLYLLQLCCKLHFELIHICTHLCPSSLQLLHKVSQWCMQRQPSLTSAPCGNGLLYYATSTGIDVSFLKIVANQSIVCQHRSDHEIATCCTNTAC